MYSLGHKARRFCGNRWLIDVFTKSRNQRHHKLLKSQLTCLISVLISHKFPTWPLSYRFSDQILGAFPIPSMYSAHLSHLVLPTLNSLEWSEKNSNYDVSHWPYVIFSSLLTFHPSQNQICSTLFYIT
jgi:hypothetical protein